MDTSGAGMEKIVCMWKMVASVMRLTFVFFYMELLWCSNILFNKISVLNMLYIFVIILNVYKE